MAWSESQRSIAVHDVLDLYPSLGIPHFQRGMVWGNDSVSALLESLFLETPCGSFVFWKSSNICNNGIPLLQGNGDQLRYLIVDGQQRIRSLYDVLHHVDQDHSENGMPENVQNDGPVSSRFWCLNLTRDPDVGHLLLPHGKEYSLFVFTADPKQADSRSPLRYNVVPLVPLLGNDNSPIESYYEYLKFRDKPSELSFKERFPGVLERLQKIRSREFFVTVKDTENRAAIVSLYNRINTGGKKVEAEERAFSRLIAMDPNVWSQITAIFDLVHGRDALLPNEKGVVEHATTSGANRDQVLKRQKENLFGFKFFIRTFLQVCNYHFNQPIGSSSFSFSIVDRKSFADRLETGDPESVQKLWQISREVICHFRGILKEELHCDDLVFLPETFSLVPVFQILIQYPGLRGQKYRSLFSWLSILLLMAEPSTREVLGWTRAIQQESGAAFRLIPGILRTLERRVRDRLDKERVLDDASSIQNRYVLLLYWLLRKNGARDFSHENLSVDKNLYKDRKELVLKAEVNPEKQHIIPFSRLVKKLEDVDAQRGSSHRFNNIGNLTYISREFNHYDTGIGDGFIDVAFDSHDALDAHCLWSKEEKNRVQDLYTQAARVFGGEVPGSIEQARKLYEDFCRRRRSLIAQAFEKWIDELGTDALKNVGARDLDDLEGLGRGESRLESVPPMFVSARELRPDQRVRLFGYENLVEDELARLVQPLRRKCFLINEHCMEVKLTDKKHVWLRLDNSRVTICLDSRIDEQLQKKILASLKMGADEDVVYENGSGSVERVKNLGAARERAQHLKDEIERSITDGGGGGAVMFEEKWKEQIGEWAVDELRRFTKKLESLVEPEIKVSNNKKGKPFYSLQVGDRRICVLRPRSYKPTLTENFRSAELKHEKQIEAVERFKTRLLDVGIANVYGKIDSIEIPLKSALERFKELKGHLGDLSRELAEAMEV